MNAWKNAAPRGRTSRMTRMINDRVLRVAVGAAVIAAATVVGVAASREPAAAAARPARRGDYPGMVSIKPGRYVETRPGQSTIDGEDQGGGRLVGGQEYRFTLAGRPGIGKTADAVMMNVTAVRPDGPGHVSVYPCGTATPNVSSINYGGGDVTPNAVLSKLGGDGEICVSSLRTTDLIIDVNAYVPAGGTPTAINPVRNVDTRTNALGNQPAGRLAGGQEHRFTIAGQSGVPKGADAAMMNITAVRPDAPGYITVYPCGAPRPTTSNINYEGGDVTPNAVLSKLGSGGQICIFTLQTTDLIIDVNAFVPAGGTPTSINPVRNVDTRTSSTLGNQANGRLVGGQEHRFTIAGQNGIPKNADAAMMNITAVRPDGPGHVTVYPCGTTTPNVSSINYTGGDVAPNAVYSKLGTDGQLCIFTLQDTDLIIDINAFSTRTTTPPTTSTTTTTSTTSTTTTTTTTLPPDPEQCVIDGQPIDTPLNKVTCDALLATYEWTDGSGWIDEGGWATPTDPCTWLGITCTDGKLTSIKINGNSVWGTLPPEFANLTDLTELDLASNELGGFSESITELTNLTSLKLSNNQISDELPSSIGNLTNLTYLNLSNQTKFDPAGLYGPIPESIGNLTKLTYLDLGYNDFEGPIPYSIGNLTNLEVLGLYENELTGAIPDSIGNLSKLEQLYLDDNQLTGTVPDFLIEFTNLRVLNLQDNLLTGPIPEFIGELVKLENILMDGNELTGAIPDSIGNLTNLEQLYLHNNKLSGPIPTALPSLTNLSSFLVRGNGCLTATDETLIAWLKRRDHAWADGC